MTVAKPLPRCPVEVTLTLIDDRWKVLILRELLYGTRRFGEIRKALGNVSTKVLTANLRSMEENGLLTRRVYPEVPPKVEYTLTELGVSLKPILFAMVEWGSNYKSMVEGQMPMRTSRGKIMLIMKAALCDFQEIVALQELSVSDGNSTQFVQPKATDFFLKAMDEQDKIVGVIAGNCENDVLHISLIAVHPDYQKQGIGTKLLEEAERGCPHGPLKLSADNSDSNITGFFERSGYEKIDQQGNCTVYQKKI